LARPKKQKEEESTKGGAEGGALGRREAIERVGGLFALGATGSVFGWGMVRGRHAFEIEEVVVRVAGLPRALDGYTIAQVSDLHAGVMVGERELREGFERVAQIRPDLVVATGDLVDFDAAYAPLISRALAGARARDGVYAILGNHDYYTGAPEVVAAVDRAGVELLVNAGTRIRPFDGGGFALLGVDDLWARRSGGRGPDLERAIAMVPESVPRILLAHQPRYLDRSHGQVALQLSGHTHGGQINPGFRPADMFMPYVAGRYEKSGTVMWVNRGFGVVGPPARIGAPPEVTKIILVSG
jgi:predicted MPP superfamily phosphohydrolase